MEQVPAFSAGESSYESEYEKSVAFIVKEGRLGMGNPNKGTDKNWFPKDDFL